MYRAAFGNLGLHGIAVLEGAEVAPQVATATEQDGRGRHVKLVDQPGSEERSHGADPASDSHVVSASDFGSLSERLLGCRSNGVERCATRHVDLVEGAVGENEHWHAERRRVARRRVRLRHSGVHALENVVDGAFFNSGKSCCGIERIYVDVRVYDEFVERAAGLAKQYVLGNPLEAATTLGPMVRGTAADDVRAQITSAIASGARALLEPASFGDGGMGSPYLAPQLLVDVNHSTTVMTEESFGPVVVIMSVMSDDEAFALMNDSAYGLSASI